VNFKDASRGTGKIPAPLPLGEHVRKTGTGGNGSFIRQAYPYYLLLPAIILFTVFFIAPAIGGVFISLTNWDITRPAIRFNGFDNYIYMFGDADFILAISNTLIFMVSIVILRNTIAILLALALTSNLKTSTYLRTAFYIPSVLSYVVVGIMFTALFQMNGTVNQGLRLLGFAVKHEWLASQKTALLTVIAEDVWKWTGFHMIIYIAGINAIPSDFYESARIDGASYPQRFFHITLPLLVPALTVNVTQSVIGGFRVFEQVLTLTKGGPGHKSTVIGMMIYEYFGRGFYGRSTAMSMFLSVIVIIVTVLIRRAFRKGEMEL
jgi:raffinose/stachyose/melibiose transport system permease protein